MSRSCSVQPISRDAVWAAWAVAEVEGQLLVEAGDTLQVVEEDQAGGVLDEVRVRVCRLFGDLEDGAGRYRKLRASYSPIWRWM